MSGQPGASLPETPVSPGEEMRLIRRNAALEQLGKPARAPSHETQGATPQGCGSDAAGVLFNYVVLFSR